MSRPGSTNEPPPLANCQNMLKTLNQRTKLRCRKDRLRSRRTTDVTNPLRVKEYIGHRERVHSIKPRVDSTPPIISKNAFSSPTLFNIKINTFVSHEKENARLLATIANIMSSEQGMTSTRHLAVTKNINNRGVSRQLKLIKLAKANIEFWDKVSAVKAVYNTKKLLQRYKYLEGKMEDLSYYPLFWREEFCTKPYGSVNSTCLQCTRMARLACLNAIRNPKPIVFFDLKSQSGVLGQITIELRADIVPMAAENFRSLCTGETGFSYKHSQLHRVVGGLWWEFGIIAHTNCQFNKSIYGDYFADENFLLKHDTSGVVSMVNCGPNTNGTMFLITAKPLPALNGTNVVVGKVVEGLGVLENIDHHSQKPKEPVWISNVGQIDADPIYSQDDDIPAKHCNYKWAKNYPAPSCGIRSKQQQKGHKQSKLPDSKEKAGYTADDEGELEE